MRILLLKLLIITLALVGMLVGAPNQSRADSAALTPPFTNGWLTPQSPQIETAVLSNNMLEYAGSQSIGALNVNTGQNVWEWHDEKHIFAASAFEGSRLYSVIFEFGIIADDAVTGKRLWTLPVTTDINTMCVDNDTLFVELHPGHIAALNTLNHKTIWEAPLAPKSSKTPLIIDDVLAVNHQKLLVLAATPDSVQAGAYTILCLAPSSGSVIWRTPLISSGGDWAVSCVADANFMYAAFANGGMKAYSLQNGALKWSQTDTGTSIVMDGRQIVSVIDGTVQAVDCVTGKKTWSVTLSKQVQSPFSKPSLRGSDIWIVGDGRLYCVAASGALRWKYQLEDAAPTPPIFLSDGFLLPIGGSLTRFHHGESPALPTGTVARQALATDLVSRLDELSIVDKHGLIALGDDAFPALLTELKSRIATYYSAKNPDYSSFSHCADDLSAVMQPNFTQSILDLLPMAPRLNGDDSIRQELLGILADKGDTTLTLNLFITILKTEKPDWGYRFNATSIALEVVRKSDLPAAVAYLVSALNDAGADEYIRHVAYESAARTGDPSAIRAVLASRNSDRSTDNLSIVMGLAQLGVDPSQNPNGYGTALLATGKDGSGQLWGLVQSGLAGADSDLWIVKYDGKQWTDPMLTSLS